VGSTGLELPVFGFGSAHLGEMYGLVDEATSRATLEGAWDVGVRFYDTAPWYGRGLSEHRLGGLLRTRAPGSFNVTTKVGRTLHRPADPANFDGAPWLGGLPFEIHFDYSYDGIMASYEQALQRLAIPRVDALVIHDLDILHHGEGEHAHIDALVSSGYRALEELKAAGEIKAIGMGFNTADTFGKAGRAVPLDFAIVAMPYTLLDQSTLETDMARFASEGVAVIIGSPFASGILATGSAGGGAYGYRAASAEIQEKVRGLEEVCAVHGVPLQAAALQFPLAHPAVVAIIPGAVNPEQVRDNVQSLGVPIPPAFWGDAKARGLLHPDAPVPD
jgi:D-threo-aldose 1-dehydrogenase